MTANSNEARRVRVERNIYRRPTGVLEVGFKDASAQASSGGAPSTAESWALASSATSSSPAEAGARPWRLTHGFGSGKLPTSGWPDRCSTSERRRRLATAVPSSSTSARESRAGAHRFLASKWLPYGGAANEPTSPAGRKRPRLQANRKSRRPDSNRGPLHYEKRGRRPRITAPKQGFLKISAPRSVARSPWITRRFLPNWPQILPSVASGPITGHGSG